ncbi:MAG: hypothetical protein ABW217_02125 [Polyangiaceae bacterium]
MAKRRFWFSSALALVIACASAPRPAIMTQVEQVRTSPSSELSAKWAPQEHAHALQLEEQANAELRAGDVKAAELLSERALVAHEHAAVLTRLAQAEQRRIAADAELAARQKEISELQTQQQRLSGEASGLELQAKVLRGAMPLAAHGNATVERRAARRVAAGAVATQARLLCLAAGMLQGKDAIAQQLAALDQLDQDVAKRTGNDVLERAMRQRSECLGRVTQARQGAAQGAPSDGLLSELSAAGAEPSRDDRGVVVVLRDLFDAGGALSSSGRASLERLAAVAKSHPEFPLLVVAHAGSAREANSVGKQLDVVKTTLSQLGAQKLEAHNAGTQQPVLPGASPRAAERNQRFDIVFVAPGV